MKHPWNPKRVDTKQPKGPGTKSVLPRYVAIGNHKKVAYTKELWPGRVFGEFDADDELIGVEIL
ncbi:MAG: DUF2283 domain-containing protein [Desulfurellales bacterium]|nr:MAG: DUF2283 domain-containing protein [Desulfurellales bacterium]